MPYISNRKAVFGRKGPSISSSEVLEAKMTDPYQRPTVSYYDASQQQPTAEQGTYAAVPAAYHPGPSTTQDNCLDETLYARGTFLNEPLYAPLPPSYTEQASDPTAQPPTAEKAEEEEEEDQPSKETPKHPVGDAVAAIISLAIFVAIMCGLAVGAFKAVDHFHRDTLAVLTGAPKQTTTTVQRPSAHELRLVTLYGPSTTVVSWVDFGPDGTGVEGREEK
jgi:hypothetical protein